MTRVTVPTDQPLRVTVPGAPVPPRGRHLVLLAVLWTVFAVYGSLVPLQYQEVPLAGAIEKFRNLPPLWVGLGTRADWVANILLFIPLTFFWLGGLVTDRGRLAAVLGTVIVLPLALGLAIGLEFTQIWFAGRTVSRNDIVAEGIGACLGALLWHLAGARLVSWLRSYRATRDPVSSLQRLLVAYMVGFAVYSLMPFDLTISITDIVAKHRRGMLLLVPFSYRYESPVSILYQFFADIVTFVPVGVWALLAWPVGRPSAGAAVVRGLVAAGAFGLAVEFGQLLVGSRYTDTTDILLAAVGGSVGAWLWSRSRGLSASTPAGVISASSRRAARISWWTAGLMAYSAFLAVGFLYPFDWTYDRSIVRARYEAFFRVPFVALYRGTEYNAITQFLVRALLFAPLGVIAARISSLVPIGLPELAVLLIGLSYALAVAIGIEGAQIFLPTRIADLTEVIICFGGATAGLVLSRRFFRHPTWASER